MDPYTSLSLSLVSPLLTKYDDDDDGDDDDDDDGEDDDEDDYNNIRCGNANSGCSHPHLQHGHHHCLEQVLDDADDDLKKY